MFKNVFSWNLLLISKQEIMALSSGGCKFIGRSVTTVQVIERATTCTSYTVSLQYVLFILSSMASSFK